MNADAHNEVDLIAMYAELEAAISLIPTDMDQWIADHYPSAEELTWLLDRHRHFIKEVLGTVGDAIEQALIRVTPFGGMTVPGVGVVQVMGGKERKQFDQGRIISNLSEAIFLNDIVDDDGEFAMTIREAVEHAAAVMAQATGAMAPSFSSWRSTIIKKYGMKLDNYAAEIEPSKKSIVIR